MSLNSRRKLKPSDAYRFADAEPLLFRELAAVVCATGMLPQKELHECWQMACHVHDAFAGSLRVADIAAGHGLLAWILVLLARSEDIPLHRTAVALDIKRPKSADILAGAIVDRWPELADSVHYVEGSVDAVSVELGSDTLLVAAHACGRLSDQVLMAAIASRSSLAIMPCCHSFRKQALSLASLASVSGVTAPSTGASIEPPVIIDRFRIAVLSALGYQITENSIQAEITSFNRIIMGRAPKEAAIVSIQHPSGIKGREKSRGEIRAFEKVQSLDLANIQEVKALSQRPSREWLRSFDLSYWVDDAATGQQLADALDDLIRGLIAEGIVSRITIRDQYADPLSGRLAFTYRIELESSAVIISKEEALRLRQRICLALVSSRFSLRGG